jgi:hypothetical protein
MSDIVGELKFVIVIAAINMIEGGKNVGGIGFAPLKAEVASGKDSVP